MEKQNSRRACWPYALVCSVMILGWWPAAHLILRGTPELHTLLEVTDSVLVATAGAMALVRYYAKKDGIYLLLGSGFVGAALLDAFHAVVTSSFIGEHVRSTMASVVPWSGVTSRFFLSILLWSSVIIWKKPGDDADKNRIRETAVYGAVAASTVASFLLFALAPLPPAYYPDLFLHRPAELAPALFFGLALISYLRRLSWRSTVFEYWLVMFLTVSFLGHLLYMPFSGQLFDTMYGIAHLVKIVGYLFVLVGLFGGMYSIFKGVESEVAERMRAEESLKEARDHLESRVLERTTELAETNRFLESEILERKRAEQAADAANRAKSAFLATMSHEIRTPMNAIMGMAEVLSTTNLDAKQRVYLDLFRSSGVSLLALINEILDLSKIEAGQMTLESVPFDLSELGQEAVDFFQPKAEDKSLALRLELSPDADVRVLGDPTRTRQVLSNLLGNAAKFTATGEVVLSISRAPATTASPAIFTFAISDTGIGIPPEKLASIFDDFTQADSSTTRRFGGTGLGLGICRRISTLMGGQITVESKVGVGSTFRFLIPLHEVPREARPNTRPAAQTAKLAVPAPEPAPVPALSGGPDPLRILVAEDVIENQFVIDAFLSDLGHLLTFVENGKMAFEKAGQEDFDLVLMDIRMPEMDGLTATRLIRERESALGIDPLPIVALTADAGAEDASLSLAAGCNMHMTKPVSMRSLRNTVKKFKRRTAMSEVVS